MAKEFAFNHNLILKKLPSSTPVIVIDGRPIASRDIVEESEAVRVVLGNLACVISFNIIHSPEYPIILRFLWFELHNPNIDWINRVILGPSKSLTSNHAATKSSPEAHHISTISLQRLRKEAKSQQMFVFAMVVVPSSSSQKSEVVVSIKYQEFADVFDKVNSNNLREHRLYDFPIDL
jgi:hypothetical protein